MVAWCPDSRSAQDAAQAQKLSNVKDGSTLSNVTDDEDYDPRSNPSTTPAPILVCSPIALAVTSLKSTHVMVIQKGAPADTHLLTHLLTYTLALICCALD